MPHMLSRVGFPSSLAAYFDSFSLPANLSSGSARGNPVVCLQELQAKNEAANAKLKQMVKDQQEAEKKKVQSQEIQAEIEKQTVQIGEKRKGVVEDLAQVEPAVIDAQQGNLSPPDRLAIEFRSTRDRIQIEFRSTRDRIHPTRTCAISGNF